MRLAPSRTKTIVLLLGTAQTLAFASTYYIPAVLATPMAQDLGLSPVWVFAAFSGALVTSAFVGPWAGRRIDLFGGRGLLMISNLLFALGLALLATMQGPWQLGLAWLTIGVGMGIGLYEAAFATLVGIYGRSSRAQITGVTLVAGFASTLGWPVSAWVEHELGWRAACWTWAGVQLLIALPMNAVLPSGLHAPPEPEAASEAAAPPRQRGVMLILTYVFAVTMFTSTSLSQHLLRLLEAAGASTAAAVAAGALMGPAQVLARVAEFGLLRNMHPLVSTRLAAAGHPVAALALVVLGAPAAALFAVLHGAGNGVMTIAKGTLPLALFGPAGYGLRQGLLSAPGRVAQASSPVVFGLALERWGADAIWLTAGLTLSAFLALLALRKR